jgi:hypothetical protein
MRANAVNGQSKLAFGRVNAHGGSVSLSKTEVLRGVFDVKYGLSPDSGEKSAEKRQAAP